MKKVVFTKSSQIGVDAAYYIIDNNVDFVSGTYWFPKGSVLDFRGGSFSASESSDVKIYLQGSEVIAPAYCIFPRTIYIKGFNNDLIRAEWFNDTQSGEGEEEFINRALAYAEGCPVTLEHRDYTLKGSIKFPNLGGNTAQTLISPGVLRLSPESFGEAAILVNTHLITLKINTIIGYYIYDFNKESIGGVVRPPIVPDIPTPTPTAIRQGTGIRFYGNGYNCNVQVELMYDLNKAFDFSPVTAMSEGKPNNGGIQYCRVEFQRIQSTTYGIYFDIYSGNYTSEETIKEEDGKYTLFNWCNENRILGGKLGADYGIYVVDKPEDYSSGGSMDGLVFENIGLEGIMEVAMYLNDITQSKFINLRMMESLPEGDKPWIVFNKHVTFTDLSIKGHVVPKKIQVGKGNRGVILNGWVMEDYWGLHSRFNRMAIMPYGATEKITDPETGDVIGHTPQEQSLTAYSSIVPFDMEKTLEANATASGDKEVETSFSINDMIPYLINYNEDTKENFPNHVRPSTLNVSIGKKNLMKLDLRGVRDLGPSLQYINATIEDTGKLVIVSDRYVRWQDTSNDKITYTFTRSGLYRLTWDRNWNLLVTDIKTQQS